MPICFFSSCFLENASSDQTAGADPDNPDITDPGRGARDDPERVCCYTLLLQRGRQYIPLQKCGKATLYAHVGLPGTLWTGVFAHGGLLNNRESVGIFRDILVMRLTFLVTCFPA